MSGDSRVVSEGAAATEAVAAALASELMAGDVVLIEGELGAGKTTFVRGACRALGVTGRVTSPTFTIGQRYPAPVPVAHLDLYRVQSLAAEEDDLLAGYVRPDAIAFVEWPREEPLLLAPGTRVAARVRIEHAGGEKRTIEVYKP